MRKLSWMVWSGLVAVVQGVRGKFGAVGVKNEMLQRRTKGLHSGVI